MILRGDDIMNIPYAMRRCTKCGEWLVANNYNFYSPLNFCYY